MFDQNLISDVEMQSETRDVPSSLYSCNFVTVHPC